MWWNYDNFLCLQFLTFFFFYVAVFIRSARAATIKYRLRGLNSRNLFCHSSGAGCPISNAGTVSFWWKLSLGLHLAPFSLCPHMTLPLFVERQWSLVSSSSKALGATSLRHDNTSVLFPSLFPWPPFPWWSASVLPKISILLSIVALPVYIPTNM